MMRAWSIPLKKKKTTSRKFNLQENDCASPSTVLCLITNICWKLRSSFPPFPLTPNQTKKKPHNTKPRIYIWCILYIFILITWQMGGILQSFLKADKRPLVLLHMMICEDRISPASVDDYIVLSICLPLEVVRVRYSSHRLHKQK